MKATQHDETRGAFSRRRRWILTSGLLALVDLAVIGIDVELKSALASPAEERLDTPPTPAAPTSSPIEVHPNGSKVVPIRRRGESPPDEEEVSWLCRVLQPLDGDSDVKLDSLVAGCEYRIEVTDYDVIIPFLPPELDGLSVLQLTDIHIGRYITREETLKMAEIAASLQPDLVVLTGDFSFHPESPRELVEALEPFGTIPAPLGRYASIGNHDYWDGEEMVREALRAVEIPLLVNENREIAPGFWLASLDDVLAGQADLERTLERIPNDSTTVLLSHNPNILPRVAERPLVVLAGHTHGGQIRLPWQDSLPAEDPGFYARLMTAFEMTGYWIYGGNREGVGMWRYMEGWFQDGQAWMYVCRGLGMSRPPIRYDCPAEMTVFRLRSKAAEG